MHIDISIDEILNRFIDNYEEKEIVGWTATAAGNGIHIEYEDKVLTWKDYERSPRIFMILVLLIMRMLSLL